MSINSVTSIIQNQIIDIVADLAVVQRECIDIYNSYWKTDASTLVPALTNDTDPATVNSKLTKAEYISGITFCEDLNDFFQNGAVTTTDYAQTCYKIKYGNADLATQLSEAVENIGDRVLQICLDAIQLRIDMQNVVDIYFDEEVGDTVSALDGERIIYGSDMVRNDLSNIITLFQQFENMMANSAVTSGDYSAMISKWSKYSKI